MTENANHAAPAHRAGIVPEQYFRWRAGEITRLEAFCDVVFGFAITLLVVSLEVPHSYAELLADLRGFLVLFYVYPLKFVFTTLFLEFIGIDIPGGLSWHEGSVLMRIYGAGCASVFLLFVLMYFHAYKLRAQLNLNPVEVIETRAAIGENFILMLVGLVSFSIAFKSPQWAGWTYMAIGPLLGIHGSIYGKRVRLLAEKFPSAPEK